MAPRERVPWGLLGLLTAGGAVLRFWSLGSLSLWGNEDYLALSVRSVLDNGVPLFPSGIVYPRALPLTYLTAGLAGLFGPSELVLRVPAAIFSTLTIPLTFMLARRTCDRPTAWIAAALVAVSCWEIQTAHTARMYAMLGCCTMALLVAAYESEVLDRTRWRIPMLGLILLTCLLHQIAGLIGGMLVMLGIYLFLNRSRLGFVPVALVVLVIGFAANFLVETHYYEERGALIEAIAETSGEVSPERRSRLDAFERLAAPLFHEVRGAAPRLVRLLGWSYLLLATLGGLLAWAKPPKRLLFLSFIPLAFALYFQQLTLALAVVLAFYVIRRLQERPDVLRESCALLAGVSAGCAIWVVMALMYVPGPTLSVLRFAVKGLLAYPPNFLRHFFWTSPWLTLFFAVASVLIVRRALDQRRFDGALLTLLWFLVPVGMLGMHPIALVRLYQRYVYPWNPLFLILVAFGLSQAAGYLGRKPYPALRAAGIVGLVLFLALSGGAGLRCSIARVTADPGNHDDLDAFYPDLRGPAEFVCDRAASEDHVIATDILGHYAYCARADYQFTLSRKRDAEGWIGARTIPDPDALRVFLDLPRDGAVWFVVNGRQENENLAKPSPGKRWKAAIETVEARGERVYLGADARSRVYRLPATR